MDYPSSRRQKLKISVVVPCYNEEEVLAELCSRLSNACGAVVGADYEIVLVNDGSGDATWQEITNQQSSHPNVVGVNLARNYGHQIALTAGLSVCNGDRILIIDADLQDPPELLSQMWEKMDEGFDVVYGRRKNRQGETWFKKQSASVFYRLLQKMTDIEIPVDTGDFRLITRRVCDALQSMPENHRFIRGMVTWIGYKQVPVDYDRQPRYAGTTKYPLSKMWRFALDAVTGFSTYPLRLALSAGLILAMLAALMIFRTFFVWFQGDVVPGWASVMCVILILGSANMLMLGVIGEYLGRLYMQSKNRPLFNIAEILAAPNSNSQDLNSQPLNSNSTLTNVETG